MKKTVIVILAIIAIALIGSFFEYKREAAIWAIVVQKAQQGDASAQRSLGLAYTRGHGYARDDAKALEWFLKAAEQHDARAETFLGMMYTVGRGVPQNYETAVHWYVLAANQGEPFAQYNLGLAYATGLGIEKDFVRAYMWVFLANTHDHKESALLEDFKTHMTPDQITAAQKMEQDWKPSGG